MSESTSVQRLRVRFGCEGALRYVSHLDVMRVWERVCRRAGLPLSRTQGFNPRPRIALAAPLAVGVTSEAELLDLLLDAAVDPSDAMRRLAAEAPRGLTVLEVSESALKQASLQSMVRSARYEVEAADGRGAAAWRAAIEELLGSESIPWTQQRGDKVRSYDLRALVIDLELIGHADSDGVVRLGMHLRNDEQGAGRPEQVTLALGSSEEPLRIHRTGLVLRTAAETVGV